MPRASGKPYLTYKAVVIIIILLFLPLYTAATLTVSEPATSKG
jgi:hypothetical protein